MQCAKEYRIEAHMNGKINVISRFPKYRPASRVRQQWDAIG